MGRRHKVFVSFHHANDSWYKEKFERLFEERAEALISRSVQDGDIDPNLKTETIRRKIRDEYLRDSTVTVVLIGEETLKRKHVDWEISSSLRDTAYNSRSGLIGILLPTHPECGRAYPDPRTIPPRLADNLENGFARLYSWTTNADAVQDWIHEAFLRRDQIIPDNSRKMFGKNHSNDSW